MDNNKTEDEFYWGLATSAYQIEGGKTSGGKRPSIWDTFTAKKGKIKNNENANLSCNFFEKYEEDIRLLKKLGIPNFRFSISWSRIFSHETKAILPEGIAFYNNIINLCIDLEITPWITIYHWDLPQFLEDKGGWANRNIIDDFIDYINICISFFGDRVKKWMVLNEPLVFTGAGYFLGIHAPGKKGLKNFLPALHHTMICQGVGIKLIQQKIRNASVGSTFSFSDIKAYSDKRRDLNAAKSVDVLINKLTLEPLLGMGYPKINASFDKKLKKYILPGDMHLIAAKPDFIGIQCYTCEVVKWTFFNPYLKAKIVSAKKRNKPTTLMNWEINPESIYNVLHKIKQYPQIPSLIVTENGAAFRDEVENYKVTDFQRTSFIKNHIEKVLQAKSEGVKVNGYFVWSFLDNFEWAEGFEPRFGVVHVDFKTLKRTVKMSGFYFSNLIKSHRFNKANAEKKSPLN